MVLIEICFEDLCNQSMVVLKDKLARKYEDNSSRKTFSEDNLWKEPYDVLAEYPVILSTTFSSRNSLNSDVVYDYLIMDEASQVDIALVRWHCHVQGMLLLWVIPSNFLMLLQMI